MAGDPYFSDVTLLLHCDGADASTSFPDSSNSAHTVTANGNAAVLSNEADFDGTGDYLSIPSSTSLELGTGDFTIEAHVTIDSVPSSGDVIVFGRTDFSTTLDYAIGFSISGSVPKLQFWGFAFSKIHPTALSTGTKTKIGVTRSGTSLKLYVGDVVEEITVSASVSMESGGDGGLIPASGNYSVGANQGGTSVELDGKVDELRVTKGVARDLSTEESIPYPDVAELVPEQLVISVTGYTPEFNSFSSSAEQLSISTLGYTPSIALGFGGQATQGSILITGGDPILVKDLFFNATIPELWSDFTLSSTPSLVISGIFPSLDSDWEFISGLSFEATMPGFDSTFIVSPAVDFKFDATLPSLTSDISLSGQYEILFTANLPGLDGEISLGANTELSFEAKLPDLSSVITFNIPDSLFFREQFPGLLSNISFEHNFYLSAELPGLTSDFVLQTSDLTLEGTFPTLSVEMTLYTHSFQFGSTMTGFTPDIALENQQNIVIEATFYLNSEIELKKVDSLSFETTFPYLEFEGIDNNAVSFAEEFPLLIPDIQFDTPTCTKSFL